MTKTAKNGKIQNLDRTRRAIESEGVIIMDNCIIGENLDIGEYSIIGKRLNNKELKGTINNDYITKIGNNVIIGCYSVLYEGCQIDDNCIIDDYVKIGFCTVIGHNTRVIYGAMVYKNVTIGFNSIVGGFVCNRVKIGNNCSIFGKLVHRYPRPKWGVIEPSPIIGNNVVVGMGSIIIGDVKIGDNSYIASGAIVTKDVPENTIVKPSKSIYIPWIKWEGRMKD